jgi:TatA/E family protein of Tat protein translocase
MLGVGHWEIVIILLVILLVFGAKRIPDMAQGLGRGIREFRKAMREVQDEIDVNKPAPPAARPVSPPPQGALAEGNSPAPAQAQAQKAAATAPPPAPPIA